MTKSTRTQTGQRRLNVMALFAELLTLAVIALAICAEAATAAGAAYAVPAPLKPAVPGAVIRTLALTSSAALPSAARNLLVLYHSRTADGADIAVSGTLATPRGRPPAGGWPVIVWTHGTTGMAADCAPSRDTFAGPEHAYLGLTEALLDDYVKRGYAVAATDYAGLGTSGAQPYLLGVDEGRNALDLLRAARAIDPGIGPRYVVMGHSQGGQSALFTSAIAASYAPELTLLGGVAVAPASHVPQIIGRISTSTRPMPTLVFGVYVLEAYASRHPEMHLETVLSAQAISHLGDLQNGCFDQAASAGYWSAADPSRQFTHPFEPSMLPGLSLATDPGQLRIEAPTFVAQGLEDAFIPAAATRDVAARLCRAGAPLLYRTYAGESHVGVLSRSKDDAAAWVADRFAGRPAPSNCGELL